MVSSKNFSSHKIVVITTILWAFCYGLVGCRSTHVSSNTVSHLRLVVNYPLLQSESNKGELVNLKDTIPIYYFKDYVLYNIPYKETFETDKEIVSEKVKYSYFLYQEDSTYGYSYRSLEDSAQPSRLRVDSFLLRRAYAAKFDLQNKRLVHALDDKKIGIRIEKYVPDKDYGENYFDTVIFKYDEKMNGFSFSFSKDIDKAKGQKLYSARFLYNKKYSGIHKIMLPQREMLFEIQPLPAENPTRIISIIEHLKSKVGHSQLRI